jgi:hypothetical protein
MLRVGRSKWFNLLWLAPIGFGLLIIGVVVAQALRELPSVEAFIEKYPGNIPPPNGIEGIPAWANWQHFFNLFLMTFIIRSAIQILLTTHGCTGHVTPRLGGTGSASRRRCRQIRCGPRSRTR